METRCGGLFFTSKFDSGNLAKVEKVGKDSDDDDGNNYYFTGSEPKADYEFNVWTKPDAAGTPYENGNRSWFYFGVKGGSPGKLIRINIVNLNRQGKLYSQGYSPLVKTVPGKPKFDRIRDKPSFETVDGQFILSFTHRFLDVKGATTYFAFCYPWTYAESQNQMAQLDAKFDKCSKYTPNTRSDSIYYHRELLCESLDKLRIDLLTITDCYGMQNEEEPRFDSKLFIDKTVPRPKQFKGKRVYLVSSRVHPGETPASHVYNGFLEFILREDDPRAKMLRRQYVFKLIPMLNPDGVMRGHYRTDSRGVNLNRMYLDPDFSIYPSIYASKALLVHHHVYNRVKPQEDKPPSRGNSAGGNKDKGSFAVSGNGPTKDQGQYPPVDNLHQKTQSKQEVRSRTYNMVYNRGKTHTTHVSCPGEQAISVESMDDHRSMKGDKSASNTPRGDMDHDHLSIGMRKLSIDHSEYGDIEGIHSSNDIASGGECQDPEDINHPNYTEPLGNEGSDEDDNDECYAPRTGGPLAPHLSDPSLRHIPPSESGVAMYMDLHAHASKRGCFIYGNHFEAEDIQVENMLYPKLISMNTAHFDFTGCNFTERNMYLKDKREGLSKEGAGRVALYKALGIIHSYTLECNYNTGRMVNSVPPAHGDQGRATPPPLAGFPPKYKPEHYEEVGKALGIAMLDLTETNPWSRLVMSEHCSLHGTKDWVRRFIRGMRGLPRGTANRPQRAALKAGGSNTSVGGPGFVPRVAMLNKNQSANTGGGQGNPRQQNNARAAFGSTVSNRVAADATSRLYQRRNTQPAATTRNQLAPVREGPGRGGSISRRRVGSSTNPSLDQSAAASSKSTTDGRSSVVHHSMSAPVALTMSNSDAKLLPSKSMPDGSSLFSGSSDHGLEPQPPSGPAIAQDGTPVHMKMSQSPFSYRGLLNKVSPPGSGSAGRQSSGGIVATDTGLSYSLVRQVSMEGSTHSVEEEKIQQLKNLPYSHHQRSNYNRTAKPLEPPNIQIEFVPPSGKEEVLVIDRSDPVKRKNRKGGSKRRSSSHSPKSAGGGGGRGPRRLGQVDASEGGERKGKTRRRKSVAKKGIPPLSKDTCGDEEDRSGASSANLDALDESNAENQVMGSAVKITPRGVSVVPPGSGEGATSAVPHHTSHTPSGGSGKRRGKKTTADRGTPRKKRHKRRKGPKSTMEVGSSVSTDLQKLSAQLSEKRLQRVLLKQQEQQQQQQRPESSATSYWLDFD